MTLYRVRYVSNQTRFFECSLSFRIFFYQTICIVLLDIVFLSSSVYIP